MLEEIRISNFQAHQKLRVVFGPGITTIVGPSDVGKSAVIRALRWVATNTPGGDSFVRYGSPGAAVWLVVDGKTVARKRKTGGDVNTYHLDSSEFKAFGRGVPDTISAFLNMPEVCWQGQHDPSFWFGESAGEVSRQLNAIVDLGIIDVALGNAARALTKARARREVTEENLTKAKREADASSWAVACDAALVVLEQKYATANTAARRAAACREAVATVDTHQAAADHARRHAAAADALLALARTARTQRDQTARLENAINTATKAAVGASAKELDFKPVSVACRAAVEARNRLDRLSTLIEAATNKQRILCQKETALKNAEEVALAAQPKTCPTCGQFWHQTST